ncbi:transposase [Brucepastera parasyntrophica]|uniref:transposase n=1 Tax=Brucepastera parasyntrophica TaxID=2880008 RepID=UPI00210E67C5|nr:transposase [Brucepastera parasyntrophica]ULQ59237.1 transposase [Brucepastera parasyntrophica]
MELDKVSEHYIFKTRIELEGSEGDTGDFIVLRELSVKEMCGIQKFEEGESQDTTGLFEFLEEILPSCIVDSSFTKNGEKATAPEVYGAIKDSGSLLIKILETWVQSLPLAQRGKNNGKSDK